MRELVLSFEKKQSSPRFFDVEQLEVIADYYLEVSDFEGLESAVRYGEQLFPDNSAIQLRRAHYWSVTGQYAQARTLLQRLEQSEPRNTDVSYALGALNSMTNNPRRAIQYYLKAATDGYELDMVYGNIADEYYKLGETDKAVAYYRKSIDANPEEERSLYNLASTWNECGRNEEALDYFLRLVESHPYSKCAWYSLGCLYYWMAMYEKSADAFEYSLAIDKTLLNAYLGLSDAYLGMEDYGRAVQALRDAMPYADDKADVIYSMGSIYMKQGNYHAAIAYLHDAIKEDPAFGLAWADLGRCCESLGLTEEAAGYYHRAIELEPDSDEYWISLADLYIQQERIDEAAVLMENGRTGAVSRFEFNARLAWCYFRQGRRNKLFEALRLMADDSPRLLPSLLDQYPAISADLEVVAFIHDIDNN